jgi:penicillin-binding protein-related factor A (putative recombinase)
MQKIMLKISEKVYFELKSQADYLGVEVGEFVSDMLLTLQDDKSHTPKKR